ncbi:MAG: S41 family peptidase [Spirochaetaceae bacterium]
MRTTIATAALVLSAAALFTSCEELLFEAVSENTPKSIFEQVWTFAEEEYSFFEFKEVDWDDAHATYKGRLPETLETQQDQEELFDVLADMLFELKDGHVNLVSDFDRSRNWQWYLEPDPNYDYSVLERNYFSDEQGRTVHQYIGDAFILMDFEDVGYIHYRSFGSPVREEDLDYVIDRFSGDEYKGVIIDVRNNGGGSVSNVYAIGNRLVTEKTEVLEERVKTGPGRKDFSDFRPIHLEPPEEAPTYTEKPVIVLTNASSYSATNYFAAAVKGLENVTTMGDRTGGGGGLPAYTELSNGWELRVSTTRLYTLDPEGDLDLKERNVEDGVEPEVEASSTEARLAQGIDDILEDALDRLREE